MGIVILNVIGQCGPFLGSNIYPDTDGPRFIRGQSVCAAFMAFNACLALVLRCVLQWQNRRLDQQYGPRMPPAVGSGKPEEIAEENYGANFRYVL